MKKLYLLFLVFLVLFIPKTFAVTPYRLDQQVPELNGFTLREVFGNRNMAMPDLNGKTEISAGVYRLYNANGITIDYNISQGSHIINGLTSSSGTAWITLEKQEYVDNLTFTTYYESGYIAPDKAQWLVNNALTTFDTFRLSNRTITKEINDNVYRFGFYYNNQASFENYTVKVQLEHGSTATPYQVPTDGPYSDIDVGEFNLTPEQIDMYYGYYLEAVEFENRGGISMEFFLISTFFMYVLIMIVGYLVKSKYFYFAGSLLWLVPIFNYTNIFIITTSIIVFLIHLTFIFYSDKDDVFE